MARSSIYLINPKADFAPYFGAEVCSDLVGEQVTFIADLAIATVASLVPSSFEIKLCDQHSEEIDFLFPGQFIALTGKSSQIKHMIELASAFKKRGKTVLIGGPHASLAGDELRPFCDILIQGEIETIAPQLFADLERGCWKSLYRGDRPNLQQTPIPQWRSYLNDRALQGCVQTSRGCPFQCDFCDVIQYVGRKTRHKPVEQVLEELDLLYEIGYRTVFIADDNFTAHRRRVKTLLRAIAEWNQARTLGRMALNTQVSIDAADDPELLELCATAGVTEVFIGIETPNVESLAASGKRQNLGGNVQQRLHQFVAQGIGIMGGMIVGFDADDLGIFGLQAEFAEQLPVPVFSLGALVAPKSTPLRDRMAQEGRLLPIAGVGAAMAPWHSNIMPARMSQKDLETGMRWLANHLYDCERFEHRLMRAIHAFPEELPNTCSNGGIQPRPVELAGVKVVRSMPSLGPREALSYRRLMHAAQRKPSVRRHVMSSIFRYMQVRHMYAAGSYWDEFPRSKPPPLPFSSPRNSGLHRLPIAT